MSNLGLVTDSDIAKLESFEKAFAAIQKQLGSLSKIMPELNKVFSSYEKTISSLEKENGKLTTKVDKLTEAQKKQAVASESNSGVLQRQKNILEGMVAGYSRGEASILATAKAAGVANGAFKDLEKILVKQREISGKNPFDDTISATRKLEREIQVLDAQFDSLSKGISFSRNEANEYVRTMARAKAAAEAMAGDPAEWASQASYAKFVNKVIQEQTQDYKRLTGQKAQLKKRNDDLVTSQEKEASANAKTQSDLLAVEKQLKRTRIEAELAREGLSRVTATGVAGLQLRGASQESIDSYKKMRLEIEKIQKEAYKTSGALRGLSTIGRELFPALGAVGVVATFAMLARKVILATDAYNLLAARINLTAKANEKFVDIQEKLLGVATNTRQSFEAIGKLYSRLVPALDAIGGSSTDALIATEQLAGAMLKSGTSVQEAESAILQFSQAMASGKLAGDEFRSISEAAPEFMRGLAKALGVPLGSMKQLAAEGKLTTEVVSAGTVIMAENFKALGESMPITVGQAFQQLTNVLFIRTSELNNALGGNQGLAEIILNVSKSLDSGLQSLTSFAKEHEGLTAGILKGAGYFAAFLAALWAWKGLLFVLGPATAALGTATAFLGTAFVATRTAVLNYTVAAAIATGATNALSLSIRGLIATTGIGLIIAGLVTAYLQMSGSSDEASKSQEELAKTTKASAERFEEAKRTAKAFSDEYTGLAKGSLKEMIDGSMKLYEAQLKLNEEGVKLALGMNDQEYALYRLEEAYDAASTAEQISLYHKTEQTAVMYRQMIQQQKLIDTIKDSVDEEKKHKDESEKIRKEIDARTKSTEELKRIEEEMLNLKAVAIEASIIELQNSKDFNVLSVQTIHAKRKELEALRERITLTQTLNNTPEKPKDPSSKPVDEYKKLNKELENYVSSLSAKSEGLSKAQAYEVEYANLKGKTTKAIRDSIQANIAEAKSLELLENLKKARIDREKELEELRKNSKGELDDLQDQINETIYQTKIIGLNADAIRDLELAKIDDMITTLQYRAVEQSMRGDYAEKVKMIESEINLWKQLREEKAKLFGAQSKDDAKKKEKKELEDQQKEYEKIFEEVGQIFGEALFKGGDDAVKDLGKSIKNYFKTLTIRLAIEPAMKDVGNQVKNLLTGKEFNADSFASSFQTLAAGQASGVGGALLSAGLSSQAGKELLFNSSHSLAEALGASAEGAYSFARAMNGTNGVGGVATYASSLVQLAQGDVKGATFTAAGTYAGQAAGAAIGAYFGNPTVGAKIGAAIGSMIGSALAPNAKISAKGFGAEFGQQISKDLSKQYAEAVKSLGGTVSDVSFNAWGNTGRQGQNNNFTLSASRGGRSVFNSANTAEGQSDGLFLAGEIALNDANLADQSLRALFAALKETDFADNIDNVIKKIDLFSATTEELNQAMVDVSLLKELNEALPKLGGAMATLAGQNIELINSFIEMAGGIENLKSLQAEYISSIYTEQEQLALSTKNLEDAFARLGVAIPSNAAAYKALVDAQDLSTQSGQALYLALLQLAPAFKEVKQSVLSLKDTLTSTLTESLTKQIDLSREMADKAKQSSEDYFDAVANLRDSSKSLMFSSSSSQGQADITRKLFQETFQKAIAGDISALNSLSGRGEDLQAVLAGGAKSRSELLYQTALLKNQLEQASSVAEVLGLGADADSKLLEIQATSLELLKESLTSGNVTQDILKEHSTLLQNIAQRIVDSANLSVSASQDATGKTVGALFDSSGNVIARLSSDTVLNLQALANQTSAVNSQTAMTGNLVQANTASTNQVVSAVVSSSGGLIAQSGISTAALIAQLGLGTSAVVNSVDLSKDSIVTSQEVSSALQAGLLTQSTANLIQTQIQSLQNQTNSLNNQTGVSTGSIVRELNTGYSGLISSVDTNRDSIVSSQEVSSALQAGVLSEGIARLIQAEIQNVANQTNTLISQSGISTSAIINQLGSSSSALIASVDTNRDSVVTSQETTSALQAGILSTGIANLIQSEIQNLEKQTNSLNSQAVLTGNNIVQSSAQNSTTATNQLLGGFSTSLSGQTSVLNSISQDTAGRTIGAITGSSDNVVSRLITDSFMNIQALNNQTQALNAQTVSTGGSLVQNASQLSSDSTRQITLGFSNSVTGQTSTLGALTQDQIRKLTTLENVQSETLDATDLVAQFTGGSEDLLNAVLNRLNTQDTGNVSITAAINSGNLEVTNYLSQLIAAVKQQSEAQAAELKRQQDLAKAQTTLSTLNKEREVLVNSVNTASQAIFGLASQFGVFLNADLGTPLNQNTASFGVGESGLFEAEFNQITGWEAAGFKRAFYSSGGLYEQTYGQASQLSNFQQQIQAQRDLITSLGGIPAFAKGGDYQGGLALVGEKGPEVINFNQSGRVSSNQDTVKMMAKANQELVEEVKSLKEEVSLLRMATQQAVINTGKTSRILEDVTQNGTSISTTTA